MEFERPPPLRPGPPAGADETPAAPPPAGGLGVNALAELVADLLAATGLVPADKLALVRGRAGQSGSIAQALVDEGVASGEGIARMLAARHQLPLAVAPRDDILAEIRRLVRASEAFGARSVVPEETVEEQPEEEVDDLEAEDGISDAPLVRLVNSVIFQAAEDGASDIHFEPQEDALVVRLRIDGVLHEVQRIPKRLTAGVTTRLKVLAKLDIAERRKPQDGRISLNAAAAGRMLDIRVATLTTINNPAINIITVEDPVEFRLPGVNQVQINPRAGLTFAAALRSILRSDPDVVMVGEIRDSETAKISVEAALTGHLVLST